VTATLSKQLRVQGEAHIQAWQELPLVAGIGRGDADEAWFRHYLEQDHLYLASYVRFFAKLAASAPDEHVEHLVGLAWNVADQELAKHRAIGAAFGCDFDAAVASPTCTAYVDFLHRSATDFGLGLVAALPCMWGYGRLCRAIPLPPDGPFRDWIEVYRSDRYGHVIDRHCTMIDEAAPDPDRAEALFLQGLAFEVEFWNQRP
jgi:thiaminase/transcriptional activator TenA